MYLGELIELGDANKFLKTHIWSWQSVISQANSASKEDPIISVNLKSEEGFKCHTLNFLLSYIVTHYNMHVLIVDYIPIHTL